MRTAGFRGVGRFMLSTVEPWRLIPESEFRLVPWKNGQGTTAEILIAPTLGDFVREDFDWRVSRAPVLSSGPFSQFPGFQRSLTLLAGELRLRFADGKSELLQPGKVVRFAGDGAVHAELIQGPAFDLGLIHRASVPAGMRVQSLVPGCALSLPAFRGLLYANQNAVEVSVEGRAVVIPQGSAWHLVQPRAVNLTVKDGPAQVVQVFVA